MERCKAIILAAGYATRLYPLTKDTPKPLINIGRKPIIDYIVEQLETNDFVSEIFVVTNDKFFTQFTEWKNNHNYSKPIKIINDKTLTNDDRLGAVGDINFVLEQEDINCDLLVIAGDNLFEFSISKFLKFSTEHNSSSVALKEFEDIEDIRGKFGIGILNGEKLIDFEEKPMNPKSKFVATACYFFTKDDLELIQDVIMAGNADNSGDLVKYLVENSSAYGFVFQEEWFDVGSFESLNLAKEYYNSLK